MYAAPPFAEAANTGGRRGFVATAAAFGLVVGVVTTACEPQATPKSATIVVTGTSAEVKPALPARLRQSLADVARRAKKPGQATVRVISSGTGPILVRDLAPLRKPGVVEHGPKADAMVEEKLDELAGQIAQVVAPAAGLDWLTLLGRAAEYGPTDIHLISSTLSTVPPLDWRTLGWSVNVSNVTDSLERRGLIPRLAEDTVTFYGAGLVGGTQPRLRPGGQRLVATLALSVCKRAGAEQCEVVTGAVSDLPPMGKRPVPLVPLPDEERENTTRGACPTWINLSDQKLHFAANSAVVPRSADAVLRAVVRKVHQCRLKVMLDGHVADDHQGNGRALSCRRAWAVAGRLITLGMPRSALGQVACYGNTRPLVVNWTDGRFDDGKARINRRVELRFQRINR